MKTTLCALTFLLISFLAQAQEDALSVIVLKNGKEERVWITAVSEKNIEYKINEVAVNRKRVAIADTESIYFYEPKSFSDAMDLFQSYDYTGAQTLFKEVRESYKNLENLPGNYSTSAGYYEIECTRRKGDIPGMTALLKDYLSGALLRKDHKTQMELYPMWQAITKKEWPRLNNMTSGLLEEEGKWTKNQLAQIYYGKGLSLEGAGETTQALNALNAAMTADVSASAEVPKLALLACLRVLKADEGVQQARKLFGTSDEKSSSNGHRLLLEGVALCKLWKSSMGSGRPLPEEFGEFFPAQ